MIGIVKWRATVRSVIAGQSVSLTLTMQDRTVEMALPASTFSVEPGDRVVLTLEADALLDGKEIAP